MRHNIATLLTPQSSGEWTFLGYDTEAWMEVLASSHAAGLELDALPELLKRVAFIKGHGGTLTYTNEGYRLDPESETLFLCARPAKGEA
ncbi:hypothetical protein P6144_00175 [Sphingomonas sp. HITSZ_GF]|uniref:hypothetical protein n=1 Tax=Sphingomonas sp. HITSZ_GF TaxID=3037247 RepID=UPI00240DCBE0|nr:hypothetical protein [Sphingomonas sp. HITSZ_GF]MDG2532051.1 hypothetical protein [Sphingomonas sp. HITSZ_GF]